MGDPIEPLDRDALEAALPDADLRVLLMCLFQVSGDRRWLSPPYQPKRDVRLIADEDAGLRNEIRDEIRTAAIELLTTDPIVPAITDPGDDLMTEMMRWCTGDRIDDGYAPMFREDLGLTERSVAWSDGPPDRIDRHTVIVGAGASGIILGKRLLDLGVPFTILERAEDVGGTWRDNVYPGAAVDTPNHAYSFSTGTRYRWSRNFSPQPELIDYLRSRADEFGLRDHIRFGTEVTSATWDDDANVWRIAVRGADGAADEVVANDLVAAIGPFGRAKIPDIEGAASFRGRIFHTTRWPDDVDVDGARVAIIGTGASAMQIGPEIAPEVGHLTVVQRTPQWARPIPRFHDPIADGAQWLLEHVPFYAEWFRFTMLWRYGDGLLPHLRTDPEWPHPDRSLNRVNERHRVEMYEHIVSELGDRTDLLDRCVPDYPPYGKRILLDNGWYRMLCRPNVSLVTGSLVRITPTGIVVRSPDGSGANADVEIDVDVIVLSTGFEVNESVRVLHPVGRGGVTLDDVWDDDDATAYLGITIPGFPNLFVMLGPSTGLGHGGSAIFQAESQVRYVCDAIVRMIEQDIAAIEVKRAAHDEYVAAVDARHADMIWTHPGVTTYYRNSKGRVVLATPWSLLEYWRMVHDVDLADYEITPRRT